MPPERQTTQNRRHLPFKPPSRASSTTAGPSKPSSKAATKKPTTAALSSRSKPTAGPSKSKPSKSTSNLSTKPRKSKSSPPSDASDAASSGNSDSEPRNLDPETNSADEADYILAEITHHKDPDTEDVISSEPLIPRKLLTKLLHHHFRNEKTKIAKDANAVAAKYIDVFVREAVARAAFERAEGGTRGGVGDGFLEVEDLEKMGPQLAMDF